MMRKQLFILFMLTGLIVCFLPIQAFGLTLMVKPMNVEAMVGRGKNIRIPIEIRNNSAPGTPAQTIELSLLDLTQTKTGHWQAQMPDVQPENPITASSREWLSLKQDEITLDPMQVGSVEITGRTPLRAKGFYFSVLLVRQKRIADVSVQFGFLVPIILQIEGPPLRQKVDLSDVSMEYFAATAQEQATTKVALNVDNPGQTFSKLSGTIQVDAYVKDRWIKVTTSKINEISIMPGVSLNLAADMEKRLPSGKYKLTGTLYVDGRRKRPLEKEIDFSGDPGMNMLAVDQALILNPPELSIESVTGAVRTSILKLENASTEVVEIETGSMIPEDLQGVAIGTLKGNELSCDKWIRISPPKFRIRGGAKQNVRVVTRIPKDEERFPNYYGKLNLKARYPDGQSAGETNALVLLYNKKAKNEYKAKITKMVLGEHADEDSKYIVSIQCANTGNVHYIPRAEAILESGVGALIQRTNLEGDTTLMLPMSIRNYAGELDVSELEPGNYRLKTGFVMGEEKVVEKILPLSVTEKDGKKVVEIHEEEAPHKDPPPEDPEPADHADDKPKDQTS